MIGSAWAAVTFVTLGLQGPTLEQRGVTRDVEEAFGSTWDVVATRGVRDPALREELTRQAEAAGYKVWTGASPESDLGLFLAIHTDRVDITYTLHEEPFAEQRSATCPDDATLDGWLRWSVELPESGQLVDIYHADTVDRDRCPELYRAQRAELESAFGTSSTEGAWIVLTPEPAAG